MDFRAGRHVYRRACQFFEIEAQRAVLYVRQLAHISAVVVRDGKSAGTRRQKIEDLAERRDEEPNYNFPSQSALHYVVEILYELGMCFSFAGDIRKHAWNEIASWAILSGTELTHYEFCLIDRLSAAYADQYIKSVNPNCPEPAKEITAESRANVSNQIKQIFSVLKK